MKNSKDLLATEKKNKAALLKAFEEDKTLFESKSAEVGSRQGTYNELQNRSKAKEQAVLSAQQHFQAVTAGLSSNADGQEETLAAQKIGE